VSEGLEIFHETLEKLDSAPNGAQKEKVEVELKKEIKKLQRLRDQIKNWQTLSEIKDKTAINEARRRIECEMERFKVLEKEMKIKAYSKEGLSQSAKLDPREQEKARTASWINGAVDRLGTQTDALEAELEQLMIAQKAKKNNERAKQRLGELPDLIERHKTQMRRLDQLLRHLGNDRIDCDVINGIQEDVEYFVESNGEPDFCFDEGLFDQFNLPDNDDDEDNDGVDDYSDEEEDQVSEEEEEEPLKKKGSIENLKKKTSPVPVTKKAPPVSSSTPTRPSFSSTTPLVRPLTSPPPPAPIVPKISGPSFASALALASATTTATAASTPSAPALSFSDALAGGNSTTLERPLVVKSAPFPGPYQDLFQAIQQLESTPSTKLAALTSSYQHCPDGGELERSRIFTPRQPAPNTPAYYPTMPPAILENPAIYERFEVDTLFFIFYYQPRTYAQYLAARELKRQSWRFHKKYQTWFQRHEEPKTIAEDYEQGTFIYFDYEGNWCQRQKSEFTFEYRFLEDEEMV